MKVSTFYQNEKKNNLPSFCEKVSKKVLIFCFIRSIYLFTDSQRLNCLWVLLRCSRKCEQYAFIQQGEVKSLLVQSTVIQTYWCTANYSIKEKQQNIIRVGADFSADLL